MAIQAEDLNRVWGTHGGMYRSIAKRYLHHPDDVDEVVQEAFLRAWRFRARFRGDSSLASWIGTILRNECLQRIRRQRAVCSSPEVPLESWHEQGFQDTGAERALERAFVIRHLPLLRPANRAIVRRILNGEDVDMRLPAHKAAKHWAVSALRNIAANRHPYADRPLQARAAR